jgi:hypothetical protein
MMQTFQFDHIAQVMQAILPNTTYPTSLAPHLVEIVTVTINRLA